MKRLMSVSVSILIVAAISASSVIAQEMMIYPAKGQSPQQEKTDKGACMEWASQQAENYAQKQSAFNRAYSACLTGRGYTVN